MTMKVLHKTYGVGYVNSISDSIIEVKIGSHLKRMQFPKTFDGFLKTDDIELLRIISEAKKIDSQEDIKEPIITHVTPIVTINTPRKYSTPIEMNICNPLLGEKAQTIPVSSEEEMFELAGYIATLGRVGSIEAEVPKDGRDDVFKRLFPGQTDRPIELKNTPGGLPNKLSLQFRINFCNLRNCPNLHIINMGKGNGSCIGRINKSKFVIYIVQNYRFRFGNTQNVSAISENT